MIQQPLPVLYMQKRRIKILNTKWIKKCQESLKNIESFQTGSRVQTATQLVYMHNILYESMVGWAQMLNKVLMEALSSSINLKKVESIMTDEELDDIFKNYREFVKKYLEYDIKVTNLLDSKLKKSKTKKNFIETQPPTGMIV